MDGYLHPLTVLPDAGDLSLDDRDSEGGDASHEGRVEAGTPDAESGRGAEGGIGMPVGVEVADAAQGVARGMDA
ncbi:hypothetical protein GCM10009677_36830 [Sphaerisporangium rubeum]